MWYRDGRLREYEAWSCDDVDSVHNDYQRHLLCVGLSLQWPLMRRDVCGWGALWVGYYS